MSDGAGHDHTAFTDPVTGRYSIPVVGGTTHTVVVTAVPVGYEEVRRQVDVGDSEVTVDFALPLSPSCVAPGYRARDTGRVETFDDRWAPQWRWFVSNVDPGLPGYDSRPGWVFANPGRRPNNTGGRGNFAIVDSDYYGQHHVQDTTLVSPIIDMSRFATPFLEFRSDLNAAVNSIATVDLSIDGGRTWNTVWHSTGFTGPRGAGVRTVPIPQAARKSSAQARFHYTGQWSGWWQVDNVFLGNRSCEMVAAPG